MNKITMKQLKRLLKEDQYDNLDYDIRDLIEVNVYDIVWDTNIDDNLPDNDEVLVEFAGFQGKSYDYTFDVKEALFDKYGEEPKSFSFDILSYEGSGASI